MNSHFFDVIIVGSGASGMAAAWRLLTKGLKVACIEQGDFLSENSFIPLDRGGELQKYYDLSPDTNQHETFASLSLDSTDSPIQPILFNAVGGSTILHSSQYPQFHKSDFKTKSIDDCGFDWPIEYYQLLPYYSLDYKITGVSGQLGDPMYPHIKDNLMPHVPLGPMGNILARSYDSLGWHWWPSYSALNTEEYDNRPADSYIRPTNLGDPTGAKGSVNHTYLKKSLTLGLKLFSNTKVLSIQNTDSHVTSVFCRHIDGSSFYLSASIYILACGGIGTPRLLLSSDSSKLECKGLANSSNLVGKNLMLHPLGYAEGFFHENLLSNHGPQGCCILSQEFYNTRPEHSFKRGYTMQILRGPNPIEFAISLCRRKLIKFGSSFWDEFHKYFNHSAHIAIICEDLPEISNCVSLSNSNNRSNDLPSVSVHYELSNNSKKMLSHGVSKARHILKNAGAYKSFGFGPVRSTGWHILGTCKMGSNPNTSVVDKNGKCHDMDNLYIFDASIFVTSGGVNPCSTIQALSLYLSDKLASNVFNS